MPEKQKEYIKLVESRIIELKEMIAPFEEQSRGDVSLIKFELRLKFLTQLLEVNLKMLDLLNGRH